MQSSLTIFKNTPLFYIAFGLIAQLDCPCKSSGFFAMKKISLTRGQFAIVDDKDFGELNSYKWYAVVSKYTFYAERSKSIGNGRHINIRMHRQLFGLSADNKSRVDHIDENGLNNQRKNLRVCTHAQNKRNVTKRNLNTLSIYKGVTFHKRDNKWMAQIRVDYKNIFCGYFEDQKQAALAYNAAAKKYHGEFANLNKILK